MFGQQGKDVVDGIAVGEARGGRGEAAKGGEGGGRDPVETVKGEEVGEEVEDATMDSMCSDLGAATGVEGKKRVRERRSHRFQALYL